jgi:hypothetical protein
VFSVFALLYRHALRQRATLELDPVETLETRYAIREHLLNGAIAVFSVTVTLGLTYGLGWPPGFASMLGGMSYGLTGPVMSVHFRGVRRAREGLRRESVTAEAVAAS